MSHSMGHISGEFYEAGSPSLWRVCILIPFIFLAGSFHVCPTLQDSPPSQTGLTEVIFLMTGQQTHITLMSSWDPMPKLDPPPPPEAPTGSWAGPSSSTPSIPPDQGLKNRISTSGNSTAPLWIMHAMHHTGPRTSDWETGELLFDFNILLLDPGIYCR